jgi:putative phosphoesterase
MDGKRACSALGATQIPMPHRLAIISDVHADLHALQDALEQIDGIGCDEIVCAGDLTDFGLFPEETLALLMARGIPCIRGNHDRWSTKEGAPGWDLSNVTATFLAQLPTRWETTIEGVRVAVHHGSPRGDMDGIDPEHIDLAMAQMLLRKADCDVLIVGHTHRAFRLDVAGGRSILHPAALLRDPAPGAENPPATGTLGVLELPSREFRVYRASDGVEVAVARRVLM